MNTAKKMKSWIFIKMINPNVRVVVITAFMSSLVLGYTYYVWQNKKTASAKPRITAKIVMKKAKAVNVVTGISPVNEISHERGLILNSLKGKSPSEIKAILDKRWPTISTDIVRWLRNTNRIKKSEKIASMEFLYGSAKAISEDKSGKRHKGFFKDELLANIKINGRRKPMIIAVQCSNGMYELYGENLKTISRGKLKFTIKKGQSLVDHVSFKTAIFLARRFSLPIYINKGKKRRKISARKALATNTDYHLISVLVFPGYKFDLGRMFFSKK